MFAEVLNTVFYGTLFISLFLLDYILGNGFVDMLQKIICKFVCIIKTYIKEEAKHIHHLDNPVSLPVLFSEIFFLWLTILFLKRYKQFRCKDRIDDLLQESREAIRRTNEFLEKWRLRRINFQTLHEYSYLDEEPQKIEPLKLEVPILHMAIVDTMGTTRSQPERGDAGDTVNITDSTLLSVTSLLEDDLDYLTDLPIDDKVEEKLIPMVMPMSSPEFNDRYLWDVMEEDICNLNE